MTLPRSSAQNNNNKPPDSVSLINEPTILPDNDLATNKPLSSSLQDLTQTGMCTMVLVITFS